MTSVVQLKTAQTLDDAIVSNLVTTGDLSGLTNVQRVAYYNYRCQQAGLDPAAKPFDILKLSGKTVLYANASCTQQLCGIHNLTTQIVSRDNVEGIYLVQARVTSPDGRSSENTGAVPIEGLKGENLSNALMKATTKAIRRTVLAHIGLGMLDETEVDTIPGAVKNPIDPRGDLSSVVDADRDRHAENIQSILASDADEFQIAQMLRDYVAEFLQSYQELYIAVADELQSRKIITKSKFKEYLKVKRNETDGSVIV
jgi:hypothetical protein